MLIPYLYREDEVIPVFRRAFLAENLVVQSAACRGDALFRVGCQRSDVLGLHPDLDEQADAIVLVTHVIEAEQLLAEARIYPVDDLVQFAPVFICHVSLFFQVFLDAQIDWRGENHADILLTGLHDRHLLHGMDVVQSTLQQLYLPAICLQHQYKYGDVEHGADDEQEQFAVGQYHFAFSIIVFYNAKIAKNLSISKKKSLQKVCKGVLRTFAQEKQYILLDFQGFLRIFAPVTLNRQKI